MDVDGEDVDPSNKKSKEGSGATAKPPHSAGSQAKPPTAVNLNLPIPGGRGQAAIVKVYDVEDGAFAVNDVIEFVGVLSLNPLLAQVPLEGTDDIFAQFERKELETKNPPASLVPRLHVVHHTKLSSWANPLLPKQLDLSAASLKAEAVACRAQLHSMLTKLLLGDRSDH